MDKQSVMGQTTSGFTVIYPFILLIIFFVNHLGYTLWISTPFLPLDRALKVINVKQLRRRKVYKVEHFSQNSIRFSTIM